MSVTSQRSLINYIAAVAAPLASIALGLACAVRVAKETSGYVAAYTWFFLLILVGLITIGLLLLSLAFIIRGNARWVGLGFVASSVLLPVSYLVGVKAFERVGWSHYVHEQMIRSGPDVQTIIHKKSATDEQIAKFWEEGVSRPDPRGGHWPLDGVAGMTRLNIQGHVATAIDLRADISQGQRDEIMSAINSSPIVYKVMEDVIPSEIEAAGETPPSNNGIHPTRDTKAVIVNRRQ